jgi:hypothetical protein
MSCTVGALAQKKPQTCPVAIEHLELAYNHAGGQSRPQLVVRFANHADRRLASATFELSLLGAGGDAHPYPDDLVYRNGLDPHKWKFFTWDLAPESVDIHRTGETLLLREVKFDDDTEWKDDGSETCVLTLDYHAR